jgi:hypothetical protein
MEYCQLIKLFPCIDPGAGGGGLNPRPLGRDSSAFPRLFVYFEIAFNNRKE